MIATLKTGDFFVGGAPDKTYGDRQIAYSGTLMSTGFPNLTTSLSRFLGMKLLKKMLLGV